MAEQMPGVWVAETLFKIWDRTNRQPHTPVSNYGKITSPCLDARLAALSGEISSPSSRMKILHSATAWLICSSLGCFSIYAQSAPTVTPVATGLTQVQIAPGLTPVTDPLNFRSDMAVKISSGAEASDAAVIRLKAQTGPSGLQIDPDAEFAFAAIDIGQRLISLGKPAAAESFFKAAEQSLDALVKRTADAQVHDKAQYLRKLSLIRGNYLNEAAQAKLDIEQALALQPGDKGLLRAQQNLANSHAPLSITNPKG